MPIMTYREAICRALDEELARDERVIFFGEDVGKAGGVFKVTPGLYEKFGGDRVRDTPISENAIVGAGIGAALTGMRPVIELMFADFAAVTLDQIINQAAKLRYMSGGQITIPLTIRAAQGGGAGFASQHSQCCEMWFMHAPGLKVVVPSSPADALGLLKTAIRDNNPVVFLEHKNQYADKGEVPDGEHLVPFGVANILRTGRDVTIIATQKMVGVALAAAEQLEKDRISVEVIDPRTLVPLDLDTILESVKKTGRLVIVEEAVHAGGWGGEIATTISDQALWWLESPIIRVTLKGGGMIPFSPPLEAYAIPGKDDVLAAVRRVMTP